MKIVNIFNVLILRFKVQYGSTVWYKSNQLLLFVELRRWTCTVIIRVAQTGWSRLHNPSYNEHIGRENFSMINIFYNYIYILHLLFLLFYYFLHLYFTIYIYFWNIYYDCSWAELVRFIWPFIWRSLSHASSPCTVKVSLLNGSSKFP